MPHALRAVPEASRPSSPARAREQRRLRRRRPPSLRPPPATPLLRPGDERAVDCGGLARRDLDDLEPERLELCQQRAVPLLVLLTTALRLPLAESHERDGACPRIGDREADAADGGEAALPD